MKVLQSLALATPLSWIIVASSMSVSHSVTTTATSMVANSGTVSQTSVNITTNSDSRKVQATTISLDRADLSQPHILRVQGSPNLENVNVKINGKLVKSIFNGSIELDLVPLMGVGSYQVEISGNSPQSGDTISLSFRGKNTNITQQSSGAGSIKHLIIIKVH